MDIKVYWWCLGFSRSCWWFFVVVFDGFKAVFSGFKSVVNNLLMTLLCLPTWQVSDKLAWLSFCRGANSPLLSPPCSALPHNSSTQGQIDLSHYQGQGLSLSQQPVPSCKHPPSAPLVPMKPMQRNSYLESYQNILGCTSHNATAIQQATSSRICLLMQQNSIYPRGHQTKPSHTKPKYN